jgi:hypothetical protein
MISLIGQLLLLICINWHSKLLLHFNIEVELIKLLTLLKAPASINMISLRCHLPYKVTLLSTLVLNVEPHL